MIKVFVVLGFFSLTGGQSTDTSFHVFEGEDMNTVMEDCERVRDALIEYGSRNRGGTSAGYYDYSTLQCIKVD